MVSSEEKFSRDFIHKLKVKGFSRIPIYVGSDRSYILGNTTIVTVYKL